MHKTGTSSIQRFLAENDEQLEALGIHYVSAGRMDNQHHPLVHQPFYGTDYVLPEPQLVIGNLNAVTREVADSDATQFVISAEGFWSQTCAGLDEIYSNWLADLKRTAGVTDISVVAYLRRQDLAVESRFSHEQKDKFSPFRSLNFEQFADVYREFGYLDYAANLDRWAQLPEVTEVIVRPYEKDHLVGNDSVKDFLYVLGVSDVGHFQFASYNSSTDKVIIRNESLPRSLALVLNAAGRSGVDVRFLDRLVGSFTFNSESFPHQTAAKYIMSPEERKFLLSGFENDNRLVARAYTERGDGNLFTNVPSPIEDPFWTSPGNADFEVWIPALFSAVSRQQQIATQEQTNLILDSIAGSESRLNDLIAATNTPQDRAESMTQASDLAAARARIAELESSTSWRITAPLRAFGRQARSLRSKIGPKYADH